MDENQVIDPTQAQQVNDRVAAEQDAFQKERLERGYAFEELIRTKGWQHIKAYMENNIRFLMNKVISGNIKSYEELEFERGKIVGMQGILNEIEAAIKEVERVRTAQPTTEQ